jgi:hypothetical protein
MRLRSRNIGVAYAYEPILEEKSIRLMHLEPALHVDAPLHFTFTTDRIETLLAQYEAISYTWGEPKLECPLYLDSADGACIMVTRNLDTALRRLRRPTARRALWADAVCIDQSDDAEKSKQIPLMADIFRGASTVLAWLGGGAEEERGMQILDQLSRRPKPTPYDLEDGDIEFLEQDNNMNLIHQFLRLAWFTRLWVIQEIVMNADVVLICGASEISWARFATILRTHKDLIEKPLDLTEHSRLEGLYTVAQLWAQDTLEMSFFPFRHTLLGLVETFHSYACTDPRDRIFALYSMASDAQSRSKSPDRRYMSMDVDYSSDVRQVYQDFAVACIISVHSLKPITILHAVLARNHVPTPDDWPSWVPDWRVGKTRSLVDLARWVPDVDIFMVDLDVVAIRPHCDSELTCIVDTIMPLIDIDDAVSYVSSLRAQLEVWPQSAVQGLFQNITRLTDEEFGPEDYWWWWSFDSIMAGKETDDELFLSQARRLQDVMRGQRLFVATRPQESPILGIGSGFMRKGDEVVVLGSWSPHVSLVSQRTLVFRRTARARVVRKERVNTHRLIGMAYLAQPDGRCERCLNDSKYPRLYLE